MNKFIIFLFALVFLPIQVLANGTINFYPSFEGIPWHSDKISVIQSLTDKGYTYIGHDADGDLHFDGFIARHKVHVIEILDHQNYELVKSYVYVPSNSHKVLNTYVELSVYLEKLYGEPMLDKDEIYPPYTTNDSDERKVQAITEGKGFLNSYWTLSSDNTMGSTISINVLGSGNIDMSYESSDWSKESSWRSNR